MSSPHDDSEDEFLKYWLDRGGYEDDLLAVRRYNPDFWHEIRRVVNGFLQVPAVLFPEDGVSTTDFECSNPPGWRIHWSYDHENRIAHVLYFGPVRDL